MSSNLAIQHLKLKNIKNGFESEFQFECTINLHVTCQVEQSLERNRHLDYMYMQGVGTATWTYRASTASTNHLAHGGGGPESPRGSRGSLGVPGGLRGPGVSGVHCSWGLGYRFLRARCPCLVPDATNLHVGMHYGIPILDELQDSIVTLE